MTLCVERKVMVLQRPFRNRDGTCFGGVDGWAKCDSEQMFEALPETLCIHRPFAYSIAARDDAMEVTLRMPRG